VLSPNDGGSKEGYAERAADARTVDQRPSRGFRPCENQRSFATSLALLLALVSIAFLLMWARQGWKSISYRRIDQSPWRNCAI